MAIWRHNHEKEFLVLPNSLIRDERLSPKEVGLLCYMLSLPPDWDFSVMGLDAIMTRFGKSALTSSLKALEKAGYLRRRKNHDSKGLIVGTQWDLTDIPGVFDSHPYPDFPALDNPYLDNPALDNQLQTKNILNKEHKKQRTECIPTVFQIPDIQEVQSYCGEAKLSIDAQRFVDYYASVGWKIGNKPMMDWKAACRNWSREERKNAEDQSTTVWAGITAV